MKKNIGQLLLQIVPVMIGVYLGFVVSNWSENRKNKSQIAVFKTNIIAELQSNKSRIEEVVSYHKMVRDSSSHYRNVSKIQSLPRFFSGVRTLTLTNSAFETGVQTGLINGLEFDEIQSVNYVYTIQESYNDFASVLLSGLITMDIEENETGFKKFYRYLSVSMTDVVIKEEQLLTQYDLLLEKLKSEYTL